MAAPVVIDLNENKSFKPELNITTAFPDIIQFLPTDQIKTILHENINNQDFINRKGKFLLICSCDLNKKKTRLSH